MFTNFHERYSIGSLINSNAYSASLNETQINDLYANFLVFSMNIANMMALRNSKVESNTNAPKN